MRRLISNSRSSAKIAQPDNQGSATNSTAAIERMANSPAQASSIH